MKIQPIFSTKEVRLELSPAAKYARDLFHAGHKMAEALYRASKAYGVDIHLIAAELGTRGGKSKKIRRRKEYEEEKGNFRD